MDTITSLVKYVFVIGVGVEVALILRSLFLLAREKARGAQASVQPAEE